MNTFNSYSSVIKKFHNTISNLVSKEICLAYFEKICAEYDFNHQNNPQKDHWTNSKVRSLLEVFERLELIELLEKESVHEKSEFQKKYSYPPLITYLKLTCFDQLGSKANFKTYDGWIKSKKNLERDRLIDSSEDKLELLKDVSEEYIKLYGVKNSFFNFLNEIIPKEEKEKLMKCIIITSNYKTKNIYEIIDYEGDSSTLDKSKYLYKIRNNFTHSIYAESYAVINFFPVDKEALTLKETIYVNKVKTGVLVSSGFEEKLKDIIKIGLSEIIKNNK